LRELVAAADEIQSRVNVASLEYVAFVMIELARSNEIITTFQSMQEEYEGTDGC
jgi:hypothetical protein